MKSNLLQHIDQIPPAIARLCGRVEGGPITLKEISARASMSYRKVNWIAMQPTWANVRTIDALKFSEACGLDLLRPRRKLFYLRRVAKPGDSGLKTLAGGLPVSYIVRQINLVEEYESQSKRRRTNAARTKGNPKNKVGQQQPVG